MTAAATRKLVKDIDLALKKVDEGIEEFNDGYEEAHSASCKSDKDRLCSDLKKCISRQQRLRTQIRDWLSSSADSSCKKRLETAKKQIEVDMQRFKDLERDCKTRAFSTTALRNRSDSGLEDSEQMKYEQWLEDTLSTLQGQVDELDADIEALKKRKGDEHDRLLEQQKRHKWHIGKLEQLLRAFRNDSVSLVDLAFCRESVDVYLEMYADADYYHDDTLYECFNLADVQEQDCKSPNGGGSSPELSAAPEPVVTDVKRSKDRKAERKDAKASARQTQAAPAVQAPPAAPTRTVLPAKNTAAKSAELPAERKVSAKSAVTSETSTSKATEEPGEVKVLEDQLLSEAQEFCCKICYVHVVSAKPVLTSCAHLFCGDCFDSWLAQHPESQSWAQRAKQGPDRTIPCPVCKHELNVKTDLHPINGSATQGENLLLWRMLSSLKVMCCNNPKLRQDGACNWIGEYGTFQQHYACCGNEPLESFKQLTAGDEACSETTAGESAASDGESATSSSPQGSSSVSVSPDPVERLKEPEAETKQVPSSKGEMMNRLPSPARSERSSTKKASTPCRAVSCFEPSASDTTLIGVSTGDRLEVQTRHESGWAYCRNPETSLTGWVPMWVLPIEEEPVAAPAPEPEARTSKAQEAALPVLRATAAFVASEGSQLSLSPDDLVEIVQQHSSGWTFGRHGGAEGWFPAWACAQ